MTGKTPSPTMTETSVTIRLATPDDIPAIAAIYDEIHDREEAGETTTGWLRDVYPTRKTAEDAVARGDMFVQEIHGHGSSHDSSDSGHDDSRNGGYDSSGSGQNGDHDSSGGGQIVGTGILNQIQVDVYADGRWQYPAPDNEVMVLHTLVISRKTEERGLGSAFLAYYEAFALAHGCRYLRLDTNARNKAARAFYRKHGYTEIGSVPTVFNGIPGVDLVLIEKRLGEPTMKTLFPEIPYLEGEGITLKRVTMADKESLQELVDSPAVQKHLPTFLFEQQYEDMEYVINHLYDECLEDSLILGIYRSCDADGDAEGGTDGGSMEFCGLAEMYGYRPEIRKISVGARLREAYWGQGIVSKVLRLMTDYLYDAKGIEIITASTMVVNKPAAKAAAAAGFDLVVHAAEEDWGFPEPILADKWIR